MSLTETHKQDIITEIPHSREAEEAVIGAVLIDPECFAVCRTILIDGEDAFYIHRLRFVWQAYSHLAERRIAIDNLTVSQELLSMGRLDEIGGPAFLASLLNAVPTTLNVDSYAQIVHESSIRRKTLAAANSIATAAYDPSLAIGEVMSTAAHAINQVSRQVADQHVISAHDSVKVVLDEMEKRQYGDTRIIPTGLVDFDKKFGGGAHPGELNLIAARPGQGKTSLLLQIGRNACFYGNNLKSYKKRVAFFSLEMSHTQLTRRFICQLTGIDYRAIEDGTIAPEQMADFFAAVEKIADWDLVIDHKRGATPAYIRSRCDVLASEGLDLVIVDSLNLMKSGVRGIDDYKVPDYCATELYNLAGDFDVPVWCAHQMNRSVEGRGSNSRPQLSDLREGGEQPADGVIFIHAVEDNGIIDHHELVISKQRNGPTCAVPVIFRKNYFKFENAIEVKL
jgi:replicative DNA helicase